MPIVMYIILLCVYILYNNFKTRMETDKRYVNDQWINELTSVCSFSYKFVNLESVNNAEYFASCQK